jgi:hypothetical protein
MRRAAIVMALLAALGLVGVGRSTATPIKEATAERVGKVSFSGNGDGWQRYVSLSRRDGRAGTQQSDPSAYLFVVVCTYTPTRTCDQGGRPVDPSTNDVDVLARSATVRGTVPSTTHPGETLSVALDLTGGQPAPYRGGPLGVPDGVSSDAALTAGSITSTYFADLPPVGQGSGSISSELEADAPRGTTCATTLPDGGGYSQFYAICSYTPATTAGALHFVGTFDVSAEYCVEPGQGCHQLTNGHDAATFASTPGQDVTVYLYAVANDVFGVGVPTGTIYAGDSKDVPGA